MRPEALPIAMLRIDAPLDERIAIELPADFYTLEELRHMVSVLEKYKSVVGLMDRSAAGGMQ